MRESKQQRLSRELEFQRKIAEERSDVTATPAAILERYRRNRHWRIFPKEYVYHRLGSVEGKRILDYGCGTGTITTQLAARGAQVTGFDLSPEHVRLAQRRAELDKVEDRVDLFATDGEDIKLPESEFDVVVVFALLHHTNFEPVLENIRHTLKPDGRVFIVEPVVFSRLLAILRDLTPVPKVVSPDERQLTVQDIDRIRSYFATSQVRYFNGFGRLQRLLLGQPPTKTGRVRWLLTKGIHYLDRLLFAIPGAWRAAGTVVITATK